MRRTGRADAGRHRIEGPVETSQALGLAGTPSRAVFHAHEGIVQGSRQVEVASRRISVARTRRESAVSSDERKPPVGERSDHDRTGSPGSMPCVCALKACRTP